MGIERIVFQGRKAIFGGVDLGIMASEIKLTPEVSTHDIVDDRLGEEVLGTINKNTNITIAMSLKEFDMQQLKTCLEGSLFTEVIPEDGEPVLGIGTASNGKNMNTNAKQLILQVMGSDSKEFAICAWKAIPMIDGDLSFSGNNETTLNLTFKIVPDETKADAINKMVFGDYSQFETP